MKRLLIACTVVLISVSSFAQGKIKFVNDSASLVILTTDTSRLVASDISKAGTAVGNAAGLPSGIVLVAGLYMGTNSTLLSLFTTVRLDQTAIQAGDIAGGNVILPIPGIANNTPLGSSTPWFQIKVWDATFSTFESAGTSYIGYSKPFQMNPGNSLTYVPTAPNGPNSSWTEGPIYVGFDIPEPTSLSLLGLGTFSLYVLRRRG